MSSVPPSRVADGVGELRKVLAFLRRDLLVAWSYRLPFVTDWIALGMQALVFGLIGKLIPPEALPTYGGEPVSYLEFVAIGITISSFLAVGISRLTTVIRQEQNQGTLEALMLTPTAWTTIELGSAFYDLLYVPVRTVVFLVLTAVLFGASYDASGLPAALLALIVFIPCVWGLGVISAAGTLTFRRGGGGIGFLVTLGTLSSGAFVPLAVLPEWVQELAAWNPIALAVGAMRAALLGGASVADVWPAVVRLAFLSLFTLAAGSVAFRRALARERRKGTLGLY
jgi:ABC-2 type transport system permease protein